MVVYPLPKKIIAVWEQLSEIQRRIVGLWHRSRSSSKGFIPKQSWKIIGCDRKTFYIHLKRLKNNRVLWYPRRCQGRYHWLRLYNGTALSVEPRKGMTWDD